MLDSHKRSTSLLDRASVELENMLRGVGPS